MSMENEGVIDARRRTETGTSAARRLRRAGRLPAVITYVDGSSEKLDLDEHNFSQMLRHHAGESMLLTLKIEDDHERKVVLKEVQHETVTGGVLHLDFNEVSMNEKLRVSVPVELAGEPAGVQAGGDLEHLLHEIEIECLPGDMPEEIKVDVSALQIGDTLRVSDITVPESITIITADDIAVAAVAEPRVDEDKSEEGIESGTAEPELVEKKEKQE